MPTLITIPQNNRELTTYNQHKKQLELREKLIEIEALRHSGVTDISARNASANLRAKLHKIT